MIKVIKIFIFAVLGLLTIAILAYGISKSNFSNIKKYDEPDNRPNSGLKLKQKIAKSRYYTTEVKAQGGNMANLGDFTINIADGKKLIANISLKYKDHKESSWLSGSATEAEILKNGPVLRSAVVSAISGSNATMHNNKMKKNIKDSLNKYLSNGEIEEVYFNKFIIQ